MGPPVCGIYQCRDIELAGDPGFEPGFSDPESDVLPLDESPASEFEYSKGDNRVARAISLSPAAVYRGLAEALSDGVHSPAENGVFLRYRDRVGIE